MRDLSRFLLYAGCFLMFGCGNFGDLPQSSTTSSYPSNVKAIVADDTTTLSWDALTGATSYNIYWNTSPGISKSNYKIAKVNATTYLHQNLAIGTTYYYVVTANIAAGETLVSSEVSASNTKFINEGDPNNNNLPTNTSITAGGDAVRGQLSSASDVDYFKIIFLPVSPSSIGNLTPDKDQVVEFGIKADDGIMNDNNGYITASIVSWDGTIETVLSSNNLISGIANPATNLTNKYILRAYIKSTPLTNRYYLKIEKPKSPLTIFMKNYIITSFIDSETFYEVEPNNTIASATALSANQGLISGQLSSNADTDYYKIFVPTVGNYEFTIKSNDKVVENANITAELLGSDGVAVIKSKVVSGEIYSSTNTTQSQTLGDTLAPGLYYLNISGALRKEYTITSRAY